MDGATIGNSATSPSAANHKPHTSRKAGAARTKPTTLSAKASPVTANARPSPKLRSGASNAKPRGAKFGSIASNDAKVPGTPKPKPGPTKQIGPAELGKGCHVLGLEYSFFLTPICRRHPS